MSIRKIYRPFFFLERTINGNIFLDMLQQLLMPQVQEEDGNEFILQLDGAPSHFNNVVLIFLSENLNIPLQMTSIFIIGHLGHRT